MTIDAQVVVTEAHRRNLPPRPKSADLWDREIRQADAKITAPVCCYCSTQTEDSNARPVSDLCLHDESPIIAGTVSTIVADESD